MQTQNIFTAMLPFIIPMVIALMKTALPSINKKFIPWLAPFIGALAELLNGMVTGGTISGQNAITGAALGSAAVGIREIYDQMKKQGPPPAIPCILAFSLFFVGCSTTRQESVRVTQETNGTVITERALTKAWVTGDAKLVVEKMRASNGKTLSVGAEGVSQEASMTEMIKAIAAMMGAAVQTGAKIANPAIALVPTQKVTETDTEPEESAVDVNRIQGIVRNPDGSFTIPSSSCTNGSCHIGPAAK